MDTMGPDARENFARDFPDDAACIEWLKDYRYPHGIVCLNASCPRYGRVTKHYRASSRRSYCCAYCGHHVHPTAGTIFHKSATSLHLWFYAIYLIVSTQGEISVRHIQRELRVTYKTAWRMSKQIRTLVQDDPHVIAGPIHSPAVVAGESRGGERERPPLSGLAWSIARGRFRKPTPPYRDGIILRRVHTVRG